MGFCGVALSELDSVGLYEYGSIDLHFPTPLCFYEKRESPLETIRCYLNIIYVSIMCLKLLRIKATEINNVLVGTRLIFIKRMSG